MGKWARFLPALIALFFFIVVFMPVQLYVTDILMVTPRISPYWSVTFIFLMLLLANLINWEKLSARLSILWLIPFILVLLVVYEKYSKEKIIFDDKPMIYKISPKEGIQAMCVKIMGKNYHSSWEGGKVILGNQEMKIIQWNEDLILAEQPVANSFGTVQLYIVRKDGKESNRVLYTILDPSDLNN